MNENKMLWVLQSKKKCKFFDRPFAWCERGSWPTPMAGLWRAKVFMTKHEAEEWLFQKQTRKGRDTSWIVPARVTIKTLKKAGRI